MKIKIVKPVKFIINVSIIISLFIAIFISTNVLSAEVSYKKMYISEGETLWGIAEEEMKYNEYYKGKDIRYIIYDIKHINNLESGNLYIGQELNIPNL